MTHSEKLKQGQNAFFAEPPDLEMARTCFETVIALAPNYLEGYHWLASTFERLNNTVMAVKAYGGAIKCDANDPRPIIALGRLLTSIGRVSEGIAELQRGLTLKPHYGEADARLFLAEAFEKAADIPKAIEQWKIIEVMQPSYPSHDAPMREAQRKLREYAKPQN